MLTRDTVSQYSRMNGLDSGYIPQTISDALYLVEAMGERYLWVDTLCIIQDDYQDKQQQLPLMDIIYTQAKVVIVAATGSSSSAGLPGIRETTRSPDQLTETIDGVEFITVRPEVQCLLRETIWSKRGWTFQEMLLCRRALVFSDQLVYWCCRAGTWREDMVILPPGFALGMDTHNSPWGEGRLGRTMCRTMGYTHLVQDFSKREFSDKSDVLWAFVGILKLKMSEFPKGYIWGMPYERLDATLLWQGVWSCSEMHKRHASHSIRTSNSIYNIPFPSWSWLSIDTEVSFLDGCGASIVSEVTWHEPLMLSWDKSDMMKAENAARPISMVSNSIDTESEESLAGMFPSFDTSSCILNYGYLVFVAKTVQLSVNILDNSLAFDAKSHLVNAVVHSLSSESTGKLTLPHAFFAGKSTRVGEFILLSSNAAGEPDEFCQAMEGVDCGSIKHVEGCCHLQSCNVMLIERRGTIAYRLALLKIDKIAWDKLEVEEKTITLG